MATLILLRKKKKQMQEDVSDLKVTLERWLGAGGGRAIGGRQCEEVLVTKCEDLNSISGTHTVVRTDSKLSSDFHTCAMVLSYTSYTHTHTKK